MGIGIVTGYLLRSVAVGVGVGLQHTEGVQGGVGANVPGGALEIKLVLRDIPVGGSVGQQVEGRPLQPGLEDLKVVSLRDDSEEVRGQFSG